MNLLINDMDEIIENLYLGNLNGARNIEKLKKLGIKKVLSLLEKFFWPKYNESDNIIHKTIIISDFYKENLIKYFGECLDFIRGDDKILVHCAAGSSRSANIVIKYIMWSKKMPFKEAFDFVKSKRSFASPNQAFKNQLQLFEKELIENNYDIDKIKFSEIKWEAKNNNEWKI